jgi:hypothetical protein
MYHPKMTFAMHAHALVATIDAYTQNKSEAYLNLAIRIVYSIRRYWNKLCDDGDNVNLFKHWWNEWETLTQSEKDGCNHPVQLLLMLGAFDLAKLGCDITDSRIPMINMLNEVMARKLKIKLKGIVGNRSDTTGTDSAGTKLYAVTMLQELFSIDMTNSPHPDPDVMVQEPTLIAVKESCQPYAQINPNSTILKKLGYRKESTQNVTYNDIAKIVDDTLLPYVNTFQFCLAIQKYYALSGINANVFVTNMETGDMNEMTNYISKEMSLFNGKSVHDHLKTKIDKNIINMNIFMQALLCHESESRINIVDKSILDHTTLGEMIVDLRMAIYFDLCKVKKEKWLAMIGDVTYADAYSADTDVFTHMIGAHTHGLCKDRFWAMLRASKDNADKKKVFLIKSNGSVSVCYDRIH